MRARRYRLGDHCRPGSPCTPHGCRAEDDLVGVFDHVIVRQDLAVVAMMKKDPRLRDAGHAVDVRVRDSAREARSTGSPNCRGSPSPKRPLGPRGACRDVQAALAFRGPELAGRCEMFRPRGSGARRASRKWETKRGRGAGGISPPAWLRSQPAERCAVGTATAASCGGCTTGRIGAGPLCRASQMCPDTMMLPGQRA